METPVYAASFSEQPESTGKLRKHLMIFSIRFRRRSMEKGDGCE